MSSVHEGVQAVPGAMLRYRLVEPDDHDAPLLVFENGWGASYHMWAWMQRELQDSARLLFYSRAGIGGSALRQPQTVPGLSAQLDALLDGLRLRGAVTVVGQSYGGLLASAHAVQLAERVTALVQVDPAAERPDPVLDAAHGAAAVTAKILPLLVTLRLPDSILPTSVGDLPEQDAKDLHHGAHRSARSLRAARAELDLMPQLRDVAARPSPVPRLVISAECAGSSSGALVGRMGAKYGQRIVERMQADHRLTARRGEGSKWLRLPHTHGGLVLTQDGARDTAGATMAFVRELNV